MIVCVSDKYKCFYVIVIIEFECFNKLVSLNSKACTPGITF